MIIIALYLLLLVILSLIHLIISRRNENLPFVNPDGYKNCTICGFDYDKRTDHNSRYYDLSHDLAYPFKSAKDANKRREQIKSKYADKVTISS